MFKLTKYYHFIIVSVAFYYKIDSHQSKFWDDVGLVKIIFHVSVLNKTSKWE